MTKKDGDRLRAIRDELLALSTDYGADSTTGAGLIESANALSHCLRGVSFEVRRTDPVTGRIMPRHS